MEIQGNLSAAGALKSSHATAGVGYATGAGGTVTQATNKSTAVTLNKATGEITLAGAALAAAAIVSFACNNSAVDVGDLVVCNHHATGTFGAYTINARVSAAGVITFSIRNNSAGSLSQAIVIKFALIKAVSA